MSHRPHSQRTTRPPVSALHKGRPGFGREHGADVRERERGIPVYLLPMAKRCHTGATATPPRDSELKKLLATSELQMAGYTELLIRMAANDDLRALERHLFADLARYLSEWIVGEAVLANLLAILRSVVGTVSEYWDAPDGTVVMAANLVTPHLADSDKLLVLLRFARGEDLVRQSIVPSQEWLQAAAILAALWIAVSDEEIDDDWVERWTEHQPMLFVSPEFTEYFNSLCRLVL